MTMTLIKQLQKNENVSNLKCTAGHKLRAPSTAVIFLFNPIPSFWETCSLSQLIRLVSLVPPKLQNRIQKHGKIICQSKATHRTLLFIADGFPILVPSRPEEDINPSHHCPLESTALADGVIFNIL